MVRLQQKVKPVERWTPRPEVTQQRAKPETITKHRTVREHNRKRSTDYRWVAVASRWTTYDVHRMSTNVSSLYVVVRTKLDSRALKDETEVVNSIVESRNRLEATGRREPLPLPRHARAVGHACGRCGWCGSRTPGGRAENLDPRVVLPYVVVTDVAK